MNDDAKLEALAKRLGTSAAERINVDAVARKVVAELRQAPPRRRTWIELHWLRLAAALALLAGGTFAVTRLIPGTSDVVQLSAHPPHLIADDLNDLSADQLQQVLVQFDQMVSSDSVMSDSTDLRQLDAEQLRAVLRSLEG